MAGEIIGLSGAGHRRKRGLNDGLAASGEEGVDLGGIFAEQRFTETNHV